MKQSDSSSRRPFDPTELAPDFLGPIAPEATVGLEPLRFPAFPTLDQLLQHQAGTRPHPLMQLTETRPPSKPPTIFEGLLGSNLDVLVQDAQKNPDRYDERTRNFLEELAAGQQDIKALPPAQEAMLSRAVMDFAAVRPPKARTPPVKRPQKKKPVLMMAEDELRDGREPQVGMPGDPPPYWWVG